jgi:hypothetical protein
MKTPSNEQGNPQYPIELGGAQWRPETGILDFTQMNEVGGARGAGAQSTLETMQQLYGVEGTGWQIDTSELTEANTGRPPEIKLGRLVVSEAGDKHLKELGENRPLTFQERLILETKHRDQ